LKKKSNEDEFDLADGGDDDTDNDERDIEEDFQVGFGYA